MEVNMQATKKTTLTQLVNELAHHYGVSRRPIRYFDVKKTGYLTADEIKYVKKRFKEFVIRELCVKADPDNPICYSRVKTDAIAKPKKGSTYKQDYDRIYRGSDHDSSYVDSEGRKLVELIQKGLKIKLPLGVCKISIETGLDPLVLKEVYDRAVGAYASSGSRAGMTAEQWGYGRIYSFIMSYMHNDKNKYSQKRFLKNKTDYDLFLEL
jgi:hypothetical protein